MSEERDGRDREDDDGHAASDPGPRQVLEEAPGEIETAADAATEASEELKKEVRDKVDDAREST
jgi:hypothetical protein